MGDIQLENGTRLTQPVQLSRRLLNQHEITMYAAFSGENALVLLYQSPQPRRQPGGQRLRHQQGENVYETEGVARQPITWDGALAGSSTVHGDTSKSTVQHTPPKRFQLLQ